MEQLLDIFFFWVSAPREWGSSWSYTWLWWGFSGSPPPPPGSQWISNLFKFMKGPILTFTKSTDIQGGRFPHRIHWNDTFPHSLLFSSALKKTAKAGALYFVWVLREWNSWGTNKSAAFLRARMAKSQGLMTSLIENYKVGPKASDE